MAERFGSNDIIAAASSSEATIGVWDAKTQTFLTSFKENLSNCNAFTSLGKDHLIAAQAGKSQAMHVWSWHKDQVQQRSWTPQSISSLAGSPDGTYLAGGSEKGSVYVWAATSGTLLFSWSAHYREVTSLAFTADGWTLVSTGADASISVWLMMDVLDVTRQQTSWNATPKPLFTMCQHTLPITNLWIGGGLANTVLASVSLDQSCKFWSLARGVLIRNVRTSTPLFCVVFDLWEHSAFVGAGDGRIFEIPLLANSMGRQKPSQTLDPFDGSLEETAIYSLAGHTGRVNSLAICSCGYTLVSGSVDSTIRLWDLETRQTLRTIHAKGPVTKILVLPKSHLLQDGRAAHHAGGKGWERLKSIGPLGRHVDTNPSLTAYTPDIVIDGSQMYRNIVQESGFLLQLDPPEELDGIKPCANAREIAELQQERDSLALQLQAAIQTVADLRALNSKLHKFVVDSTV